MGATLAETVRELLVADAAFATKLPGGLYLVDESTHADVGAGAQQHPINPTETPNAYEAVGASGVKKLKCCGLIMTSTEPTTNRGQGRSTFVRIYFYDCIGYARTRAAREWARGILHDRKALAGGKGVELMHFTDLTNSGDESLQGGDGKRSPSMEQSTYEGRGRW